MSSRQTEVPAFSAAPQDQGTVSLPRVTAHPFSAEKSGAAAPAVEAIVGLWRVRRV
jgi:hypothetical protein